MTRKHLLKEHMVTAYWSVISMLSAGLITLQPHSEALVYVFESSLASSQHGIPTRRKDHDRCTDRGKDEIQFNINKARADGAPLNTWSRFLFRRQKTQLCRSFFMDIRLLRLNKHVIFQLVFVEKNGAAMI